MNIEIASRLLSIAEARKDAALAVLLVELGELVWRRGEHEHDKAASIWEEAGALYGAAQRRLETRRPRTA